MRPPKFAPLCLEFPPTAGASMKRMRRAQRHPKYRKFRQNAFPLNKNFIISSLLPRGVFPAPPLTIPTAPLPQRGKIGEDHDKRRHVPLDFGKESPVA